MKFHNLRDLYLHELQELHSLADQVTGFLPELRNVIASDDLQEALVEHLDQAQEQLGRLRALLSHTSAPPEGEFDQAAHGLILAARSWAEENADSDVMDSGIIVALQRILHHEIADYGSVRTFARLLGEDQAHGFLQTSLDEAEAMDERLTRIAGTVNVAAREPSSS